MFALIVMEETGRRRGKFCYYGCGQQYLSQRSLTWFNLKHQVAPRRYLRGKAFYMGLISLTMNYQNRLLSKIISLSLKIGKLTRAKYVTEK